MVFKLGKGYITYIMSDPSQTVGMNKLCVYCQMLYQITDIYNHYLQEPSIQYREAAEPLPPEL